MTFESFPELCRFSTPNTATPYPLTWYSLAKAGPVVIDYPEGQSAGGVDDLWQRPVTGLGLFGPDKGRGGKYLLLDPGQETPAGAGGYMLLHSPTFKGFIGFRLRSANPKKRQQLLEGARISVRQARRPACQQGGAARQPEHTEPCPARRGLPGEAGPWVNEEPVQERDRMMMAMLRPLGIEKGKPFSPDARQAKLLAEAALVGEAMAKANDFDRKQMPLSHYAYGSRWHCALCLDVSQEAEVYTELDERAAWFYEAFSATHAMVTTTPGVGSIYLGTSKDKAGDWLDGADTHRLHVPPNPTVTLFWALSIHDVDSRTLIANGTQTAERNSRQPDLVKNADGSVDLHAGPKAPAGFEKNWVPTVPGKAWFGYFRFYVPTEAHFDPDVDSAGLRKGAVTEPLQKDRTMKTTILMSGARA